jgi:hypothetical protein
MHHGSLGLARCNFFISGLDFNLLSSRIKMEHKGEVERIGGGVGGLLATAVAAAAPLMVSSEISPIVTVCASFLPTAVQSLVNGRFVARYEAEIKLLRDEIENLKLQPELLTDSQIGFTLECSSIFYATGDPEKLSYLRHSIRNNLASPEIVEDYSGALSRLVRDVTVPEIVLIQKLFSFDTVYIAEKESLVRPANTYAADLGSPEAIQVTGLIRLGLLNALAPTYDATGYQWSELTAKLLALTASPA